MDDKECNISHSFREYEQHIESLTTTQLGQFYIYTTISSKLILNIF